MTTTSETACDPTALKSLVERCKSLCEGADSAVAELTAEREGFLVHNLESALQQLELILRVVGQQGQGAPREEERQGFLRRLFARNEAGDNPIDGTEDGFEPPSFDVSRHGLQGNSWTIALAELVGFLAFGRKTGVLWVDGAEENFLVVLVDGNLRHATSDCTPEGLRLGEILVGLGYLTRRQLERFLHQQGDAALVSGETLLQSGMISDDELHAALVYQVRHLFYRLVNTTNAVFRFREHMEIMLPFQVNLDINQLLLESAQASDEQGNAAQRAASVMQDWNSWRAQISSEVATAKEEPAPPVAVSPGTRKDRGKAGRQPSNREGAASNKQRKSEPAAALPADSASDGAKSEAAGPSGSEAKGKGKAKK